METKQLPTGKDYRTSDGYFRDPFTGAELKGDETRVDLELRTPRILASDGITHIPIAYKLWTKEEREKYNAGKGQGTRSSGVKTSKSDTELREKLLELKSYLLEKLESDDDKNEVSKMIDAILPDDPKVALIKRTLAGMTPEQVEVMKKLMSTMESTEKTEQ